MCIPISSYALNYYNIEKVLIDAEILENGNLKIKELIVLDGSFTGFRKNIRYRNTPFEKEEIIDFNKGSIYGGKSIKNISVKALKIEEVADFSTFDLSMEEIKRIYYEEDALDKEYVESSFRYGKTIKIFYLGDYETVGFYIEYEVEDVVVSHLDVAEIYWNFIASDFKNEIEELQIRVHLPKQDTTSYFKTFIHGDITGKTKIIDNQTTEVTIKRIKEDASIDLRVIFNNDLVKNVTKKTNELAFAKIIELEENQVKKESTIKKQEEQNEKIMVSLCYTYMICLFLWWLFVYFYFDREYPPKYKEKYYKEVIEAYELPAVEYLMENTITSASFVATLYNLIDKKKILLTKKDNKTIFELKNTSNLNMTEEYAIELLFYTFFKDSVITLEEWQEKALSKNTCKKFYNAYHNFLSCAIKTSTKEKFYESHGLPIITGIFAVLIGLFLLFASAYFTKRMELSMSYLISGLFCLYTYFIKKRSRKGNEEYHKWNAWKNYVKDFSILKEEELPPKNLWDKYYLYAIVNDCDEELGLKMDELNKNDDKKEKTELKKAIMSVILKNKNKYEKNK